jgi:glycosyltransferase involved in cell wall biosynthesis
MQFSISVIIPVYNGERFIEKAIASVLLQPEVAEIIVVNDGSTDTTQAILDELQEQNPILKIYHHENKSNKGRSASRNLGIQKANGDFIAFLDADDYFLPNRFANDFKVFQENNSCDGVYNAIGVHYYREATMVEKEMLKLTTVKQVIKPDFLFEALLSGKIGHFHIDGLTVKKALFDATGYFNEALIVAEDTDIFWKMALKGNLYTGIIDSPVAIRGVHESNIFDDKDIYKIYTIKKYESVLFWGSKVKLPISKNDLLLKWIWLMRFKQNRTLFQDIQYWVFLFKNSKELIFSYLSIKYFPVVQRRKYFFPFLYS